jgi:hypothetical protein
MDPKILHTFAKARALPPIEERSSAAPRVHTESLNNFLTQPSESPTLIPEPPAARAKRSVASKSQSTKVTKPKKERLVEEPQFAADARPPNQEEVSLLSQTLRQWYTSYENIEKAKQSIREETARMKTLENMVVTMMKSHAIGALDMASTGGRVLYKKDKRAAPVSKTQMFSILTEHQQSDEKAREIMEYIDKHKTIVWRESLSYEVLDAAAAE